MSPLVEVVYLSSNFHNIIKWNTKKLRDVSMLTPVPVRLGDIVANHTVTHAHTHTQAQDDGTTEVHGARTAHEK